MNQVNINIAFQNIRLLSFFPAPKASATHCASFFRYQFNNILRES